ncbi:MAG: hypothetical protein H7039_04450 [Bryobacteraceae bacterium]|nr:hypothetical protein [Bryobacteraceae bacterium]
MSESLLRLTYFARHSVRLFLPLLAAAVLVAEPGGSSTDEVVSKYRQALAAQQYAQRDIAADVTFEAHIPKLKKQGRLNALRQISNVGKVTYKILGFSGDDTVKKEVIARYMSAEVDSASKRSEEVGITPANYSFKYKGLNNKDGRQLHVLELKPKAKRVGLFKGELWLEADSYLPVREQGRFVKSPSLFIKKVEFTRDYEIRDGIAYLVHMQSKTDTRIVGVAELNANYTNYHNLRDSVAERVEEARRELND